MFQRKENVYWILKLPFMLLSLVKINLLTLSVSYFPSSTQFISFPHHEILVRQLFGPCGRWAKIPISQWEEIL